MVFIERCSSCPVDVEIPLLASFPYLLDETERGLTGPGFAQRAVHAVRLSRQRRRLGAVRLCLFVVAVSFDGFPVELSAASRH
jgi:hypothetical protein